MGKFLVEIDEGKFEVTADTAEDAMRFVNDEIAATAEADKIEEFRGKSGAGDLFQNQFMFGMADKAAGVAGGIGSMIRGDGFGEGFRVSRRAQKILEERARDRSGNFGTAAEVAGALTTGFTAKAPAAATALGRIGQGAREAAILGTAQGFGDSDAETLGSMLTDAATSGVASGVLGGGITAGIEGVRGAVKAGGAIRRSLQRTQDSPAQRAGEKVYQALIDDGLSPEQAAARMRNRETALINVGDENTLGLAQAASNKPGSGRTALNRGLDAQQRQSGDRLKQVIDDTLGGGDQSFNRRVTDMVKTRSNLGRDQYERAFARNFGEKHAKEFDNILKRVPPEAITIAKRVANAEGRPFGEQLLASIDEVAGTVTFSRQPSVREWHYIQRGLRGASDKAFRDGLGEIGTPLKQTRKALLELMDDANPLYAKARKQYAVESQLIEALEMGRDIMRPSNIKNADRLANDFADLSKGRAGYGSRRALSRTAGHG
jgi:hypothetical protein